MNWRFASTLLSLLSRIRSRSSIIFLVHVLKMCSCSNRNFLANGAPMSRLWRKASRACASDKMLSIFIPNRARRQKSGSRSQGSFVSFCTPNASKAAAGRLTLTFCGPSLRTGPRFNTSQEGAYRISCAVREPSRRLIPRTRERNNRPS